MNIEEYKERFQEQYSLGYRFNRSYTFDPVIQNNYLELDSRVWTVMEYIRGLWEVPDIKKMTKGNKTYVWLNYTHAVVRLYNNGIRSTKVLSKLLKQLTGKDTICESGKAYMLDQTYTVTTNGKDAWFSPGKEFWDCFTDKITATHPTGSGYNNDNEDEPEEKWKPSALLVNFKECMLQNPDNLKKYTISDKWYSDKEGTKPYKYWVQLDECLNAVMKGNFVSTIMKTDDREMPKLSFEQIVELANKVQVYSVSGKVNLLAMFNQYVNNATNRYNFYDLYWKLNPALPDLDPVKVQTSKEEHKYFWDGSNSACDLSYVAQALPEIKTCDYIYKIADDIDRVYDDERLSELLDKYGRPIAPIYRKSLVCWWLSAYRDYSKEAWRKHKLWDNLEEYIAATTVGSIGKANPWYLTIQWVWKMKGIWLTDAPSVKEEIVKKIEEQKQFNQGGY